MKERKVFSGELALCLGLIFNSFATTLMVESGFGIAAIASVPYTLSLVFDKVTFGVCNCLYRKTLNVILSVLFYIRFK